MDDRARVVAQVAELLVAANRDIRGLRIELEEMVSERRPHQP